MNDGSAEFESIMEAFTAGVRRGDEVVVDDFASKYPHYADEIRRLFPVVQMMERKIQTDGSVDDARDFLEPEIHQLDAAPANRNLGEFKIVREIGRGGMGIVYRAEQESLGRTVALKVLPESAQFDDRRSQRFRLEAKASGKLLHGNIVPLFGVGRDENLSYLVMQYIEGSSLDFVIRKLRGSKGSPLDATNHRLDTSLDVSDATSGSTEIKALGLERIEPEFSSGPDTVVDEISRSIDASISSLSSGGSYFRNVAKIGMQVSDALHYAHSQDVLHRDIKPGNLLLDENGNVWVTDFGLAKLLDDGDLTKTGETIGTLRYLPPEQFNGTSDARSDVYSLGLTIYELLVLRPAFQGSDFAQLVQEIAEKDPVSLRKINPAIPRDLETIVMKAISKSPKLRYQSAGALRDDFRLFLEGKPIRAKQTSELDRIVKAVKRRPVVSMLTTLLLLSLVGGSILTTWKWQQATASLKVARREAKSRRAINDFLTEDLLKFASPDQAGDPNIKLRTVLDRASSKVEQRFGEDPVTEAELRFQIGRIYYGLRDIEKAKKHYERALAIRRKHLGNDHAETIEIWFRVGKIERQLEHNERAIEIFDEVIAFQEGNSNAPENFLDAKIHKAISLAELNREAEAEEVIEEYVAAARQSENLDLPNGLQHLASILYDQGKYEEGELVIREVIDGTRSGAQAGVFSDMGLFMNAQNVLALIQLKRGEKTKAVETHKSNYEFAKEHYGEEHHLSLVYGKNLADGFSKIEDFDRSLQLIEELLPISEKVRGVSNRHTVSLRKLKAEVFLKSGREQQGFGILETSLQSKIDKYGPAHRETISATMKMAWEYRVQEKFQKAESLYRKAYVTSEAAYGAADKLTLLALASLGDVHRKMEMFEFSEDEQVKAVAGLRKILPPEDRDLTLSIRSLIKLYFELNQFEKALPLCEEMVASLQKVQGPRSGDVVDAMQFLKEAHLELENYEPAREVLTKIYEIKVAQDLYSDSAMRVFFLLDFVDGKLRRHEDRVSRFETFCEKAQFDQMVDGDYWKARGLLGQALMSLDRLEEAEGVLLKAYDGLRTIKDQTATEFYEKYMGRAAGRLSDLYADKGNQPESDRWRKIYQSFRD